MFGSEIYKFNNFKIYFFNIKKLLLLFFVFDALKLIFFKTNRLSDYF